ncbi:MAG TPA: GDSL-type esterase/lipase family protein [Acidobacteriota bacterium]|nr:GDSL-type esterase/lipase family protein [Acidobacteriota bacterium]
MKSAATAFLFPMITALAMLFPADAQPRGMSVPADQPVERADENSRIAHAELLEKAGKGVIDIYFAGDSITRRWGAVDYPRLLDNWNRNFFGWNAANFGWGGDSTQNILWRLRNGELDGVHPKVIVLLAGTNNLNYRIGPEREAFVVADITRGIEAILGVMREKAPGAVIILMGIFPRNDNRALMPIIDRINQKLSSLADGEKIRYLNINGRLADAAGNLYEGMADSDMLHLAVGGYQIWADALKPLFHELLGPPADEDHAPPPTGNPAARK